MTIITIGKTLTPPKNFFKWCESQIPTYKWQNKEQTILASNRKGCPLIEKRLTKKSRLTFGTKFYPFAVILVSKNRIEIQSHDYWQEIENGKEILKCRMANFERFENGKHIKASLWNNNYHAGLQSNYGYMSGAYTNTNFYPNNWNEKLKVNRDMKYLELPTIERYEIERIYKNRIKIEYLQKINAHNMATAMIFGGETTYHGSYINLIDNRSMTKKWLKENKALLKNDTFTFNEIMLDKFFKSRKAKRVKGIEKYLHYKQFKRLPKEINLTKFQKYVIKTKLSFSYYMDYIQMLLELELQLNDDSIVFPDDLVSAHDNAVDTINKIKKDLEEEEYKQRKMKLLKMEKEIDEFVFLVPKDLQEIVNEGNVLHHCVGSNYYLDQHSKGQTTILFIRKKNELNKPYFTMEYQNRKVVQTQGKYNREAIPSSVKKAISKWKKEIEKVS